MEGRHDFILLSFAFNVACVPSVFGKSNYFSGFFPRTIRALQVQDVIENALLEGRLQLSEGDDSDDSAWSMDQLSDAALVASSVLAAHLIEDPHRVCTCPCQILFNFRHSGDIPMHAFTALI